MSDQATETVRKPVIRTRYTASGDAPAVEPRIALPCERLQIVWKRTQANYDEDVAVVTAHFGAVGGGLLTDPIRSAVEAAFTTFWTGNTALYPPIVQLAEYRWYDQRVWPTRSPLLRVTDITDAPGTASGTPLPPQTAMSVTLETDTRKRWGRFYLPAMTAGALTGTNGRYQSTIVDGLAQNMIDWLQAADAAGAVPLVYSPRGGAGPPVFEAGSTQEVLAVRLDDIVDIVRRRRYQDDPYRKRWTMTP